MDNLLSPDLLSDLPLSIIHVILSRVPIREAIRTSLLSRQWRYIWAGLPHITFDKESIIPPLTNENDNMRLILFISQSCLIDVDIMFLYTPLLQEFTGCFGYTKSFVVGVESSHECSVFRHLRTIKLFDVPFDKKEVTPAVIRLITGSPNLETLEISGRFPLEDDAPQLACASLWDTESAPDFTYDSLKVIKMEDCWGELNEMKLIEVLLARSPALETLMYKPYPSICDKKLVKVGAQLLGYCRASTNVKIFFIT